MRDLNWGDGRWAQAVSTTTQDGSLIVEPAAGSDLWRTTSYGFVHDDAPALLADLPDGSAMEVAFVLGGDEQFDQAGILVQADSRHWIKAGVEVADGVLMAGAVVTAEVSDWSTGPVPAWAGHEIVVRVSRSGDAVTVRARCPLGDEPGWRLVRLAPIDPTLPWRAGPFCASPSRAGLKVTFTQWRIGPADTSLH